MIPRICSFRSISYIAKHQQFVDLVKHHGSGAIHLSRTSSKVGILMIDSEKHRNAISGRMMAQLGEIADELTISQESPETALIGLIVTAKGSYFCAGADFKLVREVLNTPERGELMYNYMSDVLNSIRRSSLVSVAVLNGPAIGGGAELATCSDYRICYDNAYIQFVHASLGAAPGWGGVSRLVDIVGRGAALRLLTTSARVSPAEALRVGLSDATCSASEESAEPARVGEEFLAPFLPPRVLAGSVRALKLAVAGATRESDALRARWCCSENIAAIEALMERKAK
jgi:ethylmalonyl-CoA/methylmalonyl-CoA decarboxylase